MLNTRNAGIEAGFVVHFVSPRPALGTLPTRHPLTRDVIHADIAHDAERGLDEILVFDRDRSRWELFVLDGPMQNRLR